MRTPDKELDVVRARAPITTPPTVLSCYLLPEFWAGCLATRAAPEVVVSRVVSEEETRAGRHTVRHRVTERAAFASTEDEARANEEMVRALEALKRAAVAKRSLVALPAYHRWLSQSTVPAANAEEEEA